METLLMRKEPDSTSDVVMVVYPRAAVRGGVASTTDTQDVYNNIPLATHSEMARGDVLERVARRVMEMKVNKTAYDPPAGVCINGAKRGRNRAPYDFIIANRRVEVKSAQLKWSSGRNHWRARWRHIKRDAYDDLLLVLYTPFGVRMYLHDHVFGVSTSGKAQAANGGSVNVYGPTNQPSISKAFDAILEKMKPMVEYATVPFSDFEDLVTTTITHLAYTDIPLGTHSPSARGEILERVARQVMETKVKEMAYDPPTGVRINGVKRGRTSAPYDFIITNRRVEVKSAQLRWETGRNRWRATWQNIKRDAYDDLLLVLYTPFGVHMYLHDHVFGVSTRGKAQAANGGIVDVCGPCNQPSISIAFGVILEKMKPMEYACIAHCHA